MPSEPAALVVFARLPIPGKAKTRLAKDVGEANAAEFYARMAERIFTVTSRCERTSSRTVFFSERAEEDGIRRWLLSRLGCVAAVATIEDVGGLSAFRGVVLS